MTKFELIDSIIVNLDTITVQGVHNALVVVQTVQKLNTLKEALAHKEKEAEKEE